MRRLSMCSDTRGATSQAGLMKQETTHGSRQHVCKHSSVTQSYLGILIWCMCVGHGLFGLLQGPTVERMMILFPNSHMFCSEAVENEYVRS